MFKIWQYLQQVRVARLTSTSSSGGSGGSRTKGEREQCLKSGSISNK